MATSTDKRRTKKLRPIQARTFKQVCSLPRDNLSTKDFWILIDHPHVVICQQRTGEPAKGSLSIPRAQFDRLVRWYITGKAKP